LIFLANSALLTLCLPDADDVPATDRLLRPAFGMYRLEWPGDPGVEFHLSHGDWLRLLRRSGFEVEDLIEVRAPDGATTRYRYVTLEWAHRPPRVWKARRRRVSLQNFHACDCHALASPGRCAMPARRSSSARLADAGPTPASGSTSSSGRSPSGLPSRGGSLRSVGMKGIAYFAAAGIAAPGRLLPVHPLKKVGPRCRPP
jgi:hypothetical protein